MYVSARNVSAVLSNVNHSQNMSVSYKLHTKFHKKSPFGDGRVVSCSQRAGWTDRHDETLVTIVNYLAKGPRKSSFANYNHITIDIRSVFEKYRLQLFPPQR